MLHMRTHKYYQCLKKLRLDEDITVEAMERWIDKKEYYENCYDIKEELSPHEKVSETASEPHAPATQLVDAPLNEPMAEAVAIHPEGQNAEPQI